VITLDQRSRFLQHLQELRRINEGDDTADAPGYSLNLVRVPVSILPGKHTRKGHGAEITMTIAAQYGEELLPRTFRNLVMNDVKDMLGVYIFEAVDHVQKLVDQGILVPKLEPTIPGAKPEFRFEMRDSMAVSPKQKVQVKAIQAAAKESARDAATEGV